MKKLQNVVKISLAVFVSFSAIIMFLAWYGDTGGPAISGERIENNQNYLQKCDTKLVLSKISPPKQEDKPGYRTARWAITKVLECPEALAMEPGNVLVLKYKLNTKNRKSKIPISKQKVPWLVHPKRDKDVLLANLPSSLIRSSEIENWWNLPDGEFSPFPYKVFKGEYREYDKLEYRNY